MATPRLGLGLSGGGFRASLFHLGTLARMAELDVLRHVEVISTVSGGSIVGALYCLRLQELLETVPDGDVTRLHYVEVVKDVAATFVAGVQRNLRMRAYASPRAALRMAFRRDYTRSDRLAELYDETFYRPAAARVPSIRADLARRTGRCRVRLADLLVRPLGRDAERVEPFDPRTQNPSRRAKVPMLFLDATTLNTGRRWIFTPTWMGEEYGSVREQDPDVNAILQGFPLATAPPKYRDLPLAIAVAASAAVPGLFAPMPLTDAYDGWLPQLVDGGARDNLGTSDLRRLLPDLDLAFVLSDASDPMSDRREPWPLKLPVLARTAFIMWDRLHDQTVEAAIQEGDAVIHTRASVDPRLVRPRAPLSPGVPLAVPRAKPPIDPAVATAIARIRTDLDCFSDVEVDALMGAGYVTASAVLPMNGKVRPFVSPAPQGDWTFSWILPLLSRPTPRLMRRLAASRYQLGKTLQIPLRALVEAALPPAGIEGAPAPAGAAGEAERAVLAAGRTAARVGHDLLLRAVTTLRDGVINTAVIPLALADLVLGDPLFRAMGRRPPPAAARMNASAATAAGARGLGAPSAAGPAAAGR
jgi:NTE family protein